VTSTIDSGYFPLTSKTALFRFKTVFNPRMKHPHALRRFVSAGILLFVFFLPLHFHSVAAKAQVTKECSCVHGTRTEAGLAVAPFNWIPVLAAETVASEFLDCLSYVRFQIHGIRAPPLTPLSSS
jgi:hypothetical protein